jgi:hypothetical protein
LTVAAIIRRIRRPTSGMVSGSWSRSSHHRVRRGVVVTKLDLLRIVDQIGEKAPGCVALRKGVRRALLELRLYRYERRAAARRERAIGRLDLARRTQSGWRGLLLRLGVSVQPSGRHRVRRREAAVRRSASEADKAEAVRTDGEVLRKRTQSSPP